MHHVDKNAVTSLNFTQKRTIMLMKYQPSCSSTELLKTPVTLIRTIINEYTTTYDYNLSQVIINTYVAFPIERSHFVDTELRPGCAFR